MTRGKTYLVWVNAISSTELSEITLLHFEALQESFLNNFGIEFVQAVYQTLIEDSRNLCLLVKSDDRVIGFLIVRRGKSKKLWVIGLQNWREIVKQLTKFLFNKPALLARLADVRPFFGRKEGGENPELQFLAVDRNFRKKGTGTKMILALHERLRQLKIGHYLVGTKKKNRGSNQFYLKKGFVFSHEVMIFGEPMNYYRSPDYRERRKMPPTIARAPRSLKTVRGSLRNIAPTKRMARDI